LAVLGLLSIASRASAGVGAENILLVVNRASWASLTVANHYVRVRDVPVSNVVYLDWKKGTDAINVETFRNEILSPVLKQIEVRGLADQIDAIIYSSDFPYRVDLKDDLKGQNPPQQLSPHASLTSATYLWQLVMTKNPNVINLQNNQYMRAAEKRQTDPPTQGFRSWYGWGSQGDLIEAGGIHYMLSMSLAITSGRGNSVAEAVGYLRQSARADGTRPKGTIYFCANGDVRSKTRAGRFAQAIDDLEKLGVAGQVVTSKLPSGKRDVAGLQVGISDFNWRDAQSTILPGAICEHLTSFGGMLGETGGQTPLTEFLRYGAAGACGTVVEPYAIQDKFPVADIQVHYARGVTLAEAFYQSVFGPYQLIIVGDPLCQPWARVPQVAIKGLTANEKVSGKVNLQVAAKVDGGQADRVEVFVNGRRVLRRPLGTALSLDTTRLPDGYHTLRAVAITADNIETQGSIEVPFQTDNYQRSATLQIEQPEYRWGETIRAKIAAPLAKRGAVIANGHVLAAFEGDAAEVDIDPKPLGCGPIDLQVVAIDGVGPAQSAMSKIVSIVVKPNLPLPALQTPLPTQLVRGMRLRVGNGPTVPIQDTRADNWLSSAGVKPGDSFALEGYFEVAAPNKETIASQAPDVAAEGVHQFQLRYTGDIKLGVDRALLHEGSDGDADQIFAPVALAPGMHRLRVVGKAGNPVKLQIRYGGNGTRSINGERFRQMGS
jgi:hypothetical protein